MEKSKKKKSASQTVDGLVHGPPLEVIKLSFGGAPLCRCVTRPKEVQCGSPVTQDSHLISKPFQLLARLFVNFTLRQSFLS